VTGSTLAAELLGAGDAVDQQALLSQTLHRVEHGVLSASVVRHRNTGDFAPMDFYSVAMIIFSAITFTHIKMSAEKHQFCHVQSLHEQLGERTLSGSDTKDMQSVGLTKGIADCILLHFAVDEQLHTQHLCGNWISQSSMCTFGDANTSAHSQQLTFFALSAACSDPQPFASPLQSFVQQLFVHQTRENMQQPEPKARPQRRWNKIEIAAQNNPGLPQEAVFLDKVLVSEAPREGTGICLAEPSSSSVAFHPSSGSQSTETASASEQSTVQPKSD
jgi:hypothetical protein